MGTAKEDYEQFVQWLHEPGRIAREDVRRFANLVLANFDSIAATSRQHNSRANHLATLARASLATTPADLPGLERRAAGPDWPWRRLLHLSIGPFRGFREEVPFDLRKRLVLVYGPNGSGKTSFCDALEHALLGNVQDADVKRIEQQQYLANIHARRFTAPRLTATTHDGRELPVAANQSAYRFCFVEKNRIDTFARIGARPPAARSELISTLFGMDQFNEFASHFNESMDPALVRLRDRQVQLQTRRQTLARDQQIVAAEEATVLALDQGDAAFADQCRAGATFADLRIHIGAADAPGRLHELNAAVNAVPQAPVEVTRQQVHGLYRAADGAADELGAADRQLAARSSQVSFRELYTAVAALQADHADQCPACETPLGVTAVNPYEKARAGLQDLADLAALQSLAAQHRETLQAASLALRAALRAIHKFIPPEQPESPVAAYLQALPLAPSGDRWWQDLYIPPGAGVDGASLDLVLNVCDEIEQHDSIVRRQLEERQSYIRERDQLQAWQLEIVERDLNRKRVTEEIASAKARIAEFEIANAGLIQSAERERNAILRDDPIKAAYDHFLPALRRFRSELPGALMAGLNGLAKDLYNEINFQDPEADKLAVLALPMNADQRIEIAYCGDNARRLDALSVLSEGHIRCLGLSILLAKALSMRTPLIVFDDAVNAIDHEHRSGIRRVLFEGERFENIQLVVTCHSNEFIKDIQNNLPRDAREDWSEYVLRHHNGDHQPQVLSNETGRNYIAKARAAINQMDDREALSNSRRALEMLASKIWRWLGFLDRGVLVVEVERPGGEPTLRNLCEALRRKLDGDPNFAHQNKGVIVEALARLLGIPAQNLIWTYLNKGTHDEENREDFDRVHVELLVGTLAQLDGLDLRRPR